jgi:hypothetical protein
MDLARAPEPLTLRQRNIVLVVAAVCAVSRLLALAKTLWDWDEALFTLAMRGYDVVVHHPHPPGFPVYIALAKAMRLFVADDFRALQGVNLVAAMLVFPAVFLFARELRLRFSTSLSAGALFAFFPNVWFFGGGAFSDVPSVVLVLFAVTFLLRGVRGRNAYWLGTLLLALAIGIRPQNLLIGLIPGAYATLHRRRAEVVVAILIGVAVVGGAFGGAAIATGSADAYWTAVTQHGDYISRVDSWRSPQRPPLWRLFDRFFVKQYQSPLLSVLASIFAIVSIAGSVRERSRSMLWNALTFAPFAMVAWLMLDRFSVSRFSIAYQPMFAIFVADGIRRVAGALAKRGERESPGTRAEAALAAIAVVAFAGYTLPELSSVRNEVAPSIAAVREARARVDPRREQLLVGHNMAVFVDAAAPGLPYSIGIDDGSQPLGAWNRTWLLAEVDQTAPSGFVFSRPRGHLWNIARRHYFEVKLEPLTEPVRFLDGWYHAERDGSMEWRWMGRRSVAALPGSEERSELRLELVLPVELVRKKANVTVRINGAVVDRFVPAGTSLDLRYVVVPADGGAANVLELEIDDTVTLPGDARALGIRLMKLGWARA